MELWVLFILVAFVSFVGGWFVSYVIDTYKDMLPSKSFKKTGEEILRPDVSEVFERRIDR